jgi:hypothetical protein
MPDSPQIVYDPLSLDFGAPGKRHYQLAFHLDSAWGYSLVPITVIRGAAGDGNGVAIIGGTHGNEYEGQIAVKWLCRNIQPDEVTPISAMATARERILSVIRRVPIQAPQHGSILRLSRSRRSTHLAARHWAFWTGPASSSSTPLYLKTSVSQSESNCNFGVRRSTPSTMSTTGTQLVISRALCSARLLRQLQRDKLGLKFLF